MSVISSGTTLTTALVQTGDTNGNLVFKTGASGTTALTLGSDQSATFAGAVSFGTSAFAAGSAASPSITFTGDTNTGIFSPAADTIAFTEGGVESMRIDSSGNVGIGTSSPAYALDVYSAASGIVKVRGGGSTNQGGGFFVFKSDNSASLAALGDTARIVGGTPDQSVTLYSNNVPITFYAGSESMRITTAGNVLIGATVTPSSASMKLAIYTASNGGFQLVAGDNSGGISQTALGGGGQAFYTYTGGIGSETYTERMRIDSSGNVGIGTSSPNARLALSDNIGSPLTISINNDSASTSAGTRYAFYYNGVLTGYILNQFDGGDFQTVYASSGISRFLVGGSERMRIAGGGDVRINTTTQYNSSLLTVVGNVATSTQYYSGGNGSSWWRAGSESTTGSPAYIVYDANNAGVYIAYGGTSWNANSDERLKTDLLPIEDAVNKVSTLRAVTGRYKTDKETVSRSFLIAQDVQAVLPEAVNVQNDERGTLGLAYTDVIPLLVASIKELNAKVTALEAQLENK